MIADLRVCRATIDAVDHPDPVLVDATSGSSTTACLNTPTDIGAL
jgi:hypothetical protein